MLKIVNMANSSIEDLKNEIADCYIKQFRKELGWLKWVTILPIKSSMKDILIWKKDLPEKFVEIEDFKFWKNVIQFLSPKLAGQIFDFLKMKREEIISRHTRSDLENLKNDILWISDSWDNNSWDDNWYTDNSTGSWNETHEDDKKSDDQDEEEKTHLNSVPAGVATSAWWTFAVYKMKKLVASHEINRMSRNLDEIQLKWTIENAIEAMEKQKTVLESRLTPHQITTVDKHINKLKDWLKSIDWDSAKLLEDWMFLWDKLPKGLLKDWGIDSKTLNGIADIADEIFWKNIDEIKDILKNSKWIENVDDSILECFSRAKSWKEVKAMTRVLKWWSKFKKFVDTFAWAMRLDVAFAWLDVRTYIESNKEADAIEKINKARGENKHNQATFQLIMWLSSVAIEWAAIFISCISTWAYWGRVWVLIWVAAWLISWGVNEAWDALYYDVKDFYLQNDLDFLKQTRWELKQAILQWIHNYKRWDTSFNEKFTTFWDSSMCSWSSIKTQSLNSACRSMIFLEELENWNPELWLQNDSYLLDYIKSEQTKDDYLKDKDEGFKKYFEESWEKMQKRIDTRMEYIKKEFEKESVINSIYKGSWAKYLTQVFTESIWYANMKKESKRDDSKDYKANIEEYKKELFKDFPKEKLEKLESIKLSNPSLFLDIMTLSPTAFIWDEDEESVEWFDNSYIENVKLVEKYREYLFMTENIEDEEHLYVDDIYRNGWFISNLLEVDFDLNRVKYETLDDKTVTNILGLWYERRWLTDISDNILQNILFGVAKELNGYSWQNDLYSLMEFYSEDQWNVNWVYFSDKWMINDDWAIDVSMTNNIQEIIYEKDVDEYVDRFIKNNFYKAVYDENWNLMYDTDWNIMYQQKSCIDTPTESIDYQLTMEMIGVFKRIVKEEFNNHTVENQLKVKKQICDVVKQNSKWKYMELPYYLILEAKKAGLWDLERQVFKWHDDAEEYIPGVEPDDRSHIDVCYMDDYNITSIDSMSTKFYISKIRTEYTAEEQYYLDRVDDARKKLVAIMGVQWFGFTQKWRQESDLDLPTDIQKIISEKAIEWDKFRELVLTYSPNFCRSPEIIKRYEEYATYFENLYRWILLAEVWYSRSNDIDSFKYFQQAMWCWYTDLFDKKWNIDPELSNDCKWFKFLHNQKFQDFYNSLLKEEIKLWDGPAESLEYLWQFWNNEEKEVAKQASYFIIMTTLEKWLLTIDWRWRVTGISNGEPIREDKKDSIKSALQDYLSRKKLPPRISEEGIKSLIRWRKREIKKMTLSERRTTDLTPIVEDAIHDNLPQVIWWYKRLQLRYDIDEQKIESWDEKTKVEFIENGTEVSMKIWWLEDVEFKDVKEWIRIANLLNWLKRNMKENPIWSIYYGWSLNHYYRKNWSLKRASDWGVHDVEILTNEILDKWYPSIKNSDKFLNFINNLLIAISRHSWLWDDRENAGVSVTVPEESEEEEP